MHRTLDSSSILASPLAFLSVLFDFYSPISNRPNARRVLLFASFECLRLFVNRRFAATVFFFFRWQVRWTRTRSTVWHCVLRGLKIEGTFLLLPIFSFLVKIVIECFGVNRTLTKFSLLWDQRTPSKYHRTPVNERSLELPAAVESITLGRRERDERRKSEE